MVDPNTRQGKRTPVTLKIKFKSETLEQFIERYAVDVSQGGIFIRTKEPLAVGTQMKFEFQLRDASPLIGGEGTVVWTRENDPSRPAIAPGMGVRFDRLAEGSQSVLERILAEKMKQAPQRQTDQPTKPPLFTDTPTRVAPAPVQDALLGPSGRKRADSEQTPLPKPMPFHSDADEFPEEAFEEATKVRALDELIAQTADAESRTSPNPMPPDELALRRQNGGRADSTLADPPSPETLAEAGGKPVPDRDSAPGLPSPPAIDAPPARASKKLLDTTPSPRAATPSQPPLDSARTRLGMEPAKAPTRAPVERTERVQGAPRAIATEQSRPIAPKRPSSAPIVVGILVFVAAAMAGVWYFVLRDTAIETASKPIAIQAGSGSAAATNPGSAAVGSGGSGSQTVPETNPPEVPNSETVIASSVAKATVEVVGTDQTGAAPFTAKLVKDKAYTVKVAAPGYATSQLDIKGGQDKVTAKLVAKPHVLAVTSDPPGAMIFVDSTSTSKVTPAEIELTAAQAAKPRVHVTTRKAGYRSGDQMVDAAAFSDEDARVVAKVDTKLAVAAVVNLPKTPKTNPGTGSGSGSGSATVPVDNGSGPGSATAPVPGPGSAAPTVPTPAPGPGSAGLAAPTTTGAAAGAGSGEPEPDWTKRN